MSEKLTGMHISATERMTNSVNGNPRYRVIAADQEGTVRILVTKSDASCSYDVTNVEAEHRRDPGATVTLGLTRAGRISTITREPRCTCDDSEMIMNGYNARVTLASDEGGTYAFNITWAEDEDMPRETFARLWDAARADYRRFVSMEITRVSEIAPAGDSDPVAFV